MVYEDTCRAMIYTRCPCERRWPRREEGEEALMDCATVSLYKSEIRPGRFLFSSRSLLSSLQQILSRTPPVGPQNLAFSSPLFTPRPSPFVAFAELALHISPWFPSPTRSSRSHFSPLLHLLHAAASTPAATVATTASRPPPARRPVTAPTFSPPPSPPRRLHARPMVLSEAVHPPLPTRRPPPPTRLPAPRQAPPPRPLLPRLLPSAGDLPA